MRLERFEYIEEILLIVRSNRAPIRHANQDRFKVVDRRVCTLVRESIRLVPEREGVRTKQRLVGHVRGGAQLAELLEGLDPELVEVPPLKRFRCGFEAVLAVQFPGDRACRTVRVVQLDEALVAVLFAFF